MNIHNVKNGDKFIAVKKMWFLDEGTIVTVTNVDDEIVSFVFDENNESNGYMDFTTFNEHFKKVENTTTEVETPTITKEYIAEIMGNSKIEIHTIFDKCTVVSCRLPNGFVITESFDCVDAENYDVEHGSEVCFNKIENKIWELESYKLREEWMRKP